MFFHVFLVFSILSFYVFDVFWRGKAYQKMRTFWTFLKTGIFGFHKKGAKKCYNRIGRAIFMKTQTRHIERRIDLNAILTKSGFFGFLWFWPILTFWCRAAPGELTFFWQIWKTEKTQKKVLKTLHAQDFWTKKSWIFLVFLIFGRKVLGSMGKRVFEISLFLSIFRQFSPFFGPDWLPSLLFSYFCTAFWAKKGSKTG